MSVTNRIDLQEFRSLLLAEISAGRLNLPVMPDVAAKAQDAALSPHVNAKILARIIEVDPGMAARILRMANSAIYAGLSEIRNLDFAIGRLGTDMVVAVLVGAAGKDTFRSPDHEFRSMLEAAWTRSLYASAAARLLGPRLELPAEECFLGGLLHAAGEPILLEATRSLIDNGTMLRPQASVLREAIAALAPAAGARLLGKWGLPESIVRAVQYQREPEEAPECFRVQARLVALASAFGSMQSGETKTDAEQLFEHPSSQEMKLDRTSLDALFEQAFEEGREFARSLG